MGLFGLTLAAVCAHFFVHAAWLLVFTAFFPALAAAIHGLSTKLEIARLSAQHAATAEQLASIVSTLDQLDVTAEPNWFTWMRLREIARVAAGIMSSENDRWRELIDHQETELPA
jgi:hypothetical protein